MRVSVAVQHHPDRAHLIDPLLALLDGLDVEIVTDPDPDAKLPSPLRTYTLACKTTPDDATHRLVIQDDALPCQHFASKALAALGERPEDLVAFFAPGAAPHRSAILRAIHKGETWARLHCLWYPTVALCWPADLARAFAAWAEDELRKPGGEPFRGDDGPVGEWCQRIGKREVWATVPSLVQHPDVERSLIGRPNRAGANRARVAAAFIDG